MNYNQFTKLELIEKIMNLEPKWKNKGMELIEFTKVRLLKILDYILEKKAKEALK